MADSMGLLLATAEGNQGVFLTSNDVDAARAMITDILERPTVAGEALDIPGLRELLGQLEQVSRPTAPDWPPTIVSTAAQRHLRILAAQDTIRRKLPARILYRCSVCANPVVTDPAYEVKKIQQEDAAFVFTLIKALLGSLPDPNVGNEERICPFCKGTDFEPARFITFCPKCHELREENVLVLCPGCGFDFLALAPEDIWEGAEDAAWRFRLNFNITLLRDALPEFEHGLYEGQARALVEAVSPEEILHGMCRCAWNSEFGRYVALLFTSSKIVWAWETPVSATESGMVMWHEVQRAGDYNDSGIPGFCGFQLDLLNGHSVRFTDFRGIGIRFSTRPDGFDLQGVRELVSGLVREARRKTHNSSLPGREAATTLLSAKRIVRPAMHCSGVRFCREYRVSAPCLFQ